MSISAGPKAILDALSGICLLIQSDHDLATINNPSPDTPNQTFEFPTQFILVTAYVAVTVVCGLKFEDYVSRSNSISLFWGWVTLTLSGALWIALISSNGLFVAVLVGDVAVTLALAVFSIAMLNEPMSPTKWAGFGCALLSMILIQLPNGGLTNGS